MLPDLSVFAPNQLLLSCPRVLPLLLLINYNIVHLLLFSNSTTCDSERVPSLQNFVPVLKNLYFISAVFFPLIQNLATFVHLN